MLHTGLYRWALGITILTFAAGIILYLLPLIVPPPHPPGYAPYAFVYNVTYVFPLLAALLLGCIAATVLSVAYYRKSRGNNDPRRRLKLLALAILLLPPLLELIYFLLPIILIIIRS